MSSDLKKSLEQLEHLVAKLEIEVPVQEEASSFCAGKNTYVRLSEDKMKAWVCVHAPNGDDELNMEAKIKETAARNGVIRGLIQKNIEKIVREGLYNEEILIAEGTPAVNGKPGYYEYFFENADRINSKIKSYGTSDYSMMMILPRVKAGDKVCRYHRAVPGMNGFTVTGEEIEAVKCQDMPAIMSHGVEMPREKDEYYASIDGAVDITDGIVDVKPVKEVFQNIKKSDGKIEFFGDIHIHGNVEKGAVICASRNVIVDGEVNDASVNSGGTVVVKGGIYGEGDCRIIAKNMVIADTVGRAKIDCGHNVLSNSFVDSEVNTKGYIIAEGKNGTIIGGRLYALMGISAAYVGNDLGTVSILSAGYSDEDYSRYCEYSKLEKTTLERLSQAVDGISSIVRDMRTGKLKNDDSTIRKINALNEDKDDCFKKLDNIRFDLKQLSEDIENGKCRSISIFEKVYAGTIVEIEGKTFRIPETTEYVKYTCEGGKITSRTIN